MPNDNLRKYYDYLKANGADVAPSYDAFANALSNENNAKKYHSYLINNGFDAPRDYNNFVSTLGILKKKGVSQSTQDGGAISSEASKTENQKRSDSLSSARRWANVTEPKVTSSKYKTDDYIDILENKPLKKKKVVSVQPDKYVPEVKVEELDVPTYKEAETMMEEDFGRKEFDAYQNINKIDKNIAFKTEDEAVEELRKKFKGSGFIFETTGVGNKIKISTSTNGGLTTINSKEFDLIPSTLYGQAQTGMPVAQTEDLNRISNDKYNEIVDFMSKSILKKTDKDFLKKEVKDYGQLVNLMADNPYKYGEEFLNQYDTDRWFDNQYKDLVIESKSLKRDEDQLLAQYDELIKNPTTPEQEAQIKNKINSLDERKNILKSKYDDLGRLNDKLKVSSAVYYKKKEKQGNTIGLISNSLVKGAFNLAKAEASITADIMPYVLPEGSIMPDVQKAKLKASGMSENEIKDYASKQLRREILPQIEKGLTDLVSFGTTDEYLQSKDRTDLEKVAMFLSESIGTALSGGGNPALQKVAFFTQSYNAIEDEMSSSQFDGLNQFEKKLISVPYAMTIGALENIGFKFTTGATKSPLFNKLVNNIVFRTFSNLPKDASATLMQNELKRNTAAMLANAGLRIVGGALVEGAVEGTQQLDEIAIKNISNAITDKDYFQDVPDITTAKGINQAIGAAATDAYYGALGGLIMSAGSESISAIRDGYSNRKSDDDFAIFSNSLKDNNLRSSIESDIKSKIVSGDITKEEAKAQIESMNKSYSILQSIPDNLSLRDQRDSFNLILEKQKIQKETEGKDPALVAAQTNRINEINNELKTISENAVQKQTTGEVPVQPEATVGREMEEGKPQAEPQGVTEEGKVAAEEEVTKRISELEALIASDNASMEKEGQGNLIPEARQSILNELQTLKAETKPIEETVVVEPITKQEQKQNLVTQENVEELRAQQATPVAQKIFTASKLAMKALPGVKVYIHNTTAEFDQGIGQKSAEGAKGAYVDGEVHINLENGADVVTMLHESLHHGLVVKGVQSGAMLDLAKGLKSVVSDKGLRQRLDDFVLGYDASEQSEEYVAELGAIMAEAQQELSTTKFQQFKNLINKIAQKLGLPVVFTASANAKNAVDFMNSLTKSIRTGQEITPTTPYSVGEAVSVKPNAPMKIKYSRKAEYNVDFVTKIPTKNLEDVVNKYEGRVFMIQSDATGVGYDSKGDPIYGGLGYITIKENVDGSIGFASVDDGTAKTTLSKMINRYGEGAKVGVLVMIQNASSTVGNYYGAKYFGRALIQLQKKSKTNYKDIANSFIDYIKSNKKIVDELNKNKTQQKLIDLIKNPEKYNEKTFAEEFIKDTTFEARRNILESLIPITSDVRTNKSTPYIKQSLKDAGFNRLDFLKEYGDNTLFTEDMYLSNEGGLLAAGFEIELPKKEELDEFISKYKNNGVKHPQFNGKLPNTGESFLLDGLYPVNENFVEFSKDETLIDRDVISDEELKKVVQETFPNDSFYEDKFTSVNSDKYIPRENRTYAHLKTPNKIIFKSNLERTNPKALKSKPADVATNVARGMGFSPEKGAKQEALVEKAKTKGFSKIKFQKIAPNGKPSNLNDKQWEQVRTPEFKKWFGDWENDPKNASKIVDDNGEPLVVYHGTRKSFDEFSYDVKPANFRAGALEYSFWFTSNKKNSELYGDQVMEVFLNSRNPIEIDYTNPESYREIVVPADKTRAMSIAEFNEKKGNIKHSQMRQGIELRMSEDKSIDGIIHRNIKDVILSDNFQAFNPNQIKSATENVGTFSAETRNIKFQKAALRKKGLSDESIKTINENYTDKKAFDFYDFDWNKESERDDFNEWIDTFESNKFDKNLSKVINLVKEDIDLLNEKRTIEEKLKAFEELIIPVLGDDVLTKQLSIYEQEVLMDPNATIESIEKGFKEAKNIINKQGDIDKSKITESQIFKGGEINLPAFEKFIEKNPEYKNVFNDWKKIFDRSSELLLMDTNAFSYNINLEKLENLYNELNTIKRRNIKFQKANTQQEAIQKAKEKYTLSVEERGNPHKQGVDAALNDLRKSDWYKTADDTQRENAERELKEFFGERLKKAPSVAKILGKPKAKKVIIKDEYKEMIRQIKMEAKAAREAKADLNSKRKMLAAAISGMVKLGKVKASQASVLVKRVSNLNLDNPVMVERFTNYAQRVFERADYQQRLDDAFAIRKGIRKALKTDNQAEVSGMAKAFTKIDPSLVEDIDAYMEMAEKVKNAVKPSRVKGLDVVMKEAASIAEISEYTNEEIARQEDIQIKELLATYDFLDNEMSLEEMQKVIDALKDPNSKMNTTEKQKYVKDYLNGRFGIMSSILESMFKTGIDPMTGEEITFDEKQKELIKRALNIDLNEMSVREAIKIVESLENFLTNQITSGLEAAVSSYEGAMNDKQLVQKGFKAKSLKFLRSGYIGRGYTEQLFSLPLMIEKMFGGINKSIEVMNKWGLTKLINGVNKANKQFNTIIDGYMKQKFYDSKGFMDAENVYERGMLATLKRNLVGSPAEMKAEFDRRVRMIQESINTLIENGSSKEQKMGELYQKIYDKLGVAEMDMDVINANASKNNLDAVNWWVNQWSKHYSDLSDISLSVYNTQLGSDLNYTPDKYKLLSSEEGKFDKEAIERNSSFALSMEYTDKNKTGVLMETTRPNELPEGRYISLDFDTNNAKSLKAALVDINTASAIRQIDGFMSSKSFNKLIPDSDDRKVIVRRVNTYIRRAKGKNQVPSDTLQDAERFLNFVTTLGVGKALGGVSQAVTQTAPVMLSTVANTGRFDIAGPEFNAWLDELGVATSNRGLESQSTVESIDRNLEASNGNIKKIIKGTEELSQVYLKWFLSKPDIFVARSAFKSYYLQNLKRRGISTDIDWTTHKADMEAVEYAQAMVDRQQNVSDPMLAGEFLASEEPMRKIARKIFLPFASFILNQKARMYNDAGVLFSLTSTKEDRIAAGRSLAGLGAELLAFQLIGFAIRKGYDELAGWLFGDDEEEKKKKIFGIEMKASTYNATKYPFKSIINDLISPLPGMTDASVTWSINAALDQYPWMDSKEIKDAVKDRNRILELKGEDPMDAKAEAEYIENMKKEATYQLFDDPDDRKWGMVGIASDTYKEVFDISKLATTGKFIDEYQGRETPKVLLEADREKASYAIAPLILFSTGFAPKDVGTITRNYIKRIKKKGVTEKQYDRYSDVQKDLGRNLKSWEIQLVKDKKESETAISEIEFIERNGGLTERQGREYLKLMKAIGETTVSDIVKIKEGQTADQILK